MRQELFLRQRFQLRFELRGAYSLLILQVSFVMFSKNFCSGVAARTPPFAK